jgi:hypothetical protein
VDEAQLARVIQTVDRWPDQADEAERQLALETLQISVVAIRKQATVSGVIPFEFAHPSTCIGSMTCM